MVRLPRCISLIIVLLFSFGSVVCFAQNGTSSVNGTVKDPQGHVVAGATVTLISLATNAVRSQTTNTNGTFSFPIVPPGDYRLEATGTGFSKEVLTDVHALIGTTTDVSVGLKVGNASETVTVNSEANQIHTNTSDATLGHTFVTQQITQLPLESRNVQSLLTLQPAVTRDGYVAGARSDQSNITLDGVDINEAQTNTIGAVTDSVSALQPANNTVIRVNSEAVEEFRVNTVNSNASQGRSSGGQIALVTKSGTNAFHGAAFEFHRPTILSANDYFNNLSGVPRPKKIRNTFGGALGGPIVKDRAFFFYSYERRTEAKQETAVRTVPLPSLGLGNIVYPNSSGGITTLTPAQVTAIFPSVGENAAALAALAAAAAKYPANDFTVGDSQPGRLFNTAGFRFNAATPVKLQSHTGRVDFNLTSKQSVFLRGSVQDDVSLQAPQFPDTPSPATWSHPWGLVAGHTWALNSSMVNSFRYGLTREAFSQQGDNFANAITFRFVFAPLSNTRTLSRTTPVHNFTDDFSWLKGNHSIQYGTNIRLISNNRTSFANAFDNAITNPSFYPGGALSNPINASSPIGAGFSSAVQNAAAAVIGRFSQYTASFTFGHDGSLLPTGSPSARDFATQDYEWYIQDSWKIRQNVTLSYGLRYSLDRPVYETQGFEVKPNIPLGDLFQLRLAGAAAGVPYNTPITVDLSGPANGRSPLYHWDYKNFQPRVAIAWSPNANGGLLGKIFGGHNDSVIRGGWGMVNDNFGQALAVNFDLNNTLGFSSNTTISANTFNVTTRPAPLFTGFNQDVRTLPQITIPGALVFPQQKAANGARRIESSLDENLVTPKNYVWNLTFERQMPAGLLLTASYVGRLAQNLLATRDIMALNNLVDKKSGMDWYTAASQLEVLRAAGTPQASVAPIPYFENLFFSPTFSSNLVGVAGLTATQAIYRDAQKFNFNDWTQTQDDIEGATGTSFFFNPQYGALSAFSTVAHSNYNAGSVSLRERFRDQLFLDFNYTYSHSLDNASGLQTSTSFGAAFILNPIRPEDAYATSDFDVKHQININSVWQLPFGHGKAFGGNAGKGLDALIGGWQISNIYRWNSGLPVANGGDSGVFDDARWATNWNVQSNATLVTPVDTCPTRGASPKLFGCNTTVAYRSFRNALPGETGQRNIFRLPGYTDMDIGVAKSFNMPYSEQHKLQLRFEVFNLTNTQRMGQYDNSRTGFGIVADPGTATPPTNWSNFTAIQGTPRVMQFGFRYSF